MKLHAALYTAVDENDRVLDTPIGQILEVTRQEVQAKLRSYGMRGTVKKVILVPFNEFSDLVEEVENVVANAA